jgi:hypothetical protein
MVALTNSHGQNSKEMTTSSDSTCIESLGLWQHADDGRAPPSDKENAKRGLEPIDLMKLRFLGENPDNVPANSEWEKQLANSGSPRKKLTSDDKNLQIKTKRRNVIADRIHATLNTPQKPDHYRGLDQTSRDISNIRNLSNIMKYKTYQVTRFDTNSMDTCKIAHN